MLSTRVTVETIDGRTDTLGALHKADARRLYSVSQQKELEWREKRRIRDLEEARAAAGGVQVMAPSAPMPGVPPPAADDPVERLAKAKAMRDKGLISEAEYETLKAKIVGQL
ncbi:MAG: SHOCT domain-containing protein [Actinobacteria bacterium]|nr:SHOCT domain-containing protein [Actinomycetota bacterium]